MGGSLLRAETYRAWWLKEQLLGYHRAFMAMYATPTRDESHLTAEERERNRQLDQQIADAILGPSRT